MPTNYRATRVLRKGSDEVIVPVKPMCKEDEVTIKRLHDKGFTERETRDPGPVRGPEVIEVTTSGSNEASPASGDTNEG